MGQLKKILREQILAEMTYERQMSDEEIADLIDRKMDACLEEQPGEFPLTLGERLKLHRSYLTLSGVLISCRSWWMIRG